MAAFWREWCRFKLISFKVGKVLVYPWCARRGWCGARRAWRARRRSRPRGGALGATPRFACRGARAWCYPMASFACDDTSKLTPIFTSPSPCIKLHQTKIQIPNDKLKSKKLNPSISKLRN